MFHYRLGIAIIIVFPSYRSLGRREYRLRLVRNSPDHSQVLVVAFPKPSISGSASHFCGGVIPLHAGNTIGCRLGYHLLSSPSKSSDSSPVKVSLIGEQVTDG
ncbi:MAG: hypothetical protein CM15mP71_5230 [Candidatus Poseidoniales archaeon]|nr:MAG: hypothetical protein CM15mP71_5230 [Candidatus Poseidoniales archaeon]